jgi:hypothetical protein
VNNTTTETINSSILNITGNNGIVDWLFIELRHGTTYSTKVVYTKSALLQRDGDIVDMDGISPLAFNVPDGNYYISIRHRNNLGFRTTNSIHISNNTALWNFTNNSIPLYGSTPLQILTQNTYVLISGDANSDGSIDAFDTLIWESQNGLFDDYSLNADYNFDGSVDAFDTLLWEMNNGKFEELD